MTRVRELETALSKTSDFLVSGQCADGTWDGAVQSDARTTAFYINTARNAGRSSDEIVPRMEAYLKHEQLGCGAWEKWPGSGPDVDVTLVCALSLVGSGSEDGNSARTLAENWLAHQKPPPLDSFWLGYLALNGYLAWSKAPHLSVRIIGNPSWVRPNIFDFSFLRLAVVATSLLQALELKSSARDAPNNKTVSLSNSSQFNQWIERWIADHTNRRSGVLEVFSKCLRAFESVFPSKKKFSMAVGFLLEHQEEDGSFFSSVHMTSIAVVALYKLDPSLYCDEIDAGFQALRKWQQVEQNGVSQQFTDSKTWDTILFFDLLQRIGTSGCTEAVERSKNYLIGCQNFHRGDWSKRVNTLAGGAWCFQRVGKWYPDCDDTAFASLALLANGGQQCRHASLEGAKWLVSMQCSSGGWASWDRNDRSWIQIPNAGPWFARDLPTVDITSRAVILLSRVLSNFDDLDDQLSRKFQLAMDKGVAWVRSQQVQGRWYGSWFTHYLYGTSHALEMLDEVDRVEDAQVHAHWLSSIVNSDGGFGEAPESGPENGFVAAASTPFHTACGLLCLCFCGRGDTAIAHRAANWLLENQASSGEWMNSDFFAAGVPGLWYANFANTSTYFAAKSLQVFKDELERGRLSAMTHEEAMA